MPAHPSVALRDALSVCERVLLTGPIGPDGDSSPACLLIQRALRARGVEVVVAGEPGFRYAWLPGADEMITDALIDPDFDAVVVLDGDRHRLPQEVDAAFRAASFRGIIDHHASTKNDGYDVAWLEPETASTCEMIYRRRDTWGLDLDPDVATLIYTGTIFDTGGFRYSNAGPATHRMAARLLEAGIDHADICARVLLERRPAGLKAASLIFGGMSLHLGGRLALGVITREERKEHGIDLTDLEGIVDGLVFTRHVEVAVLLIGRGDHVKFSLRSRGLVDVARVAGQLAETGGGHPKAAGATVMRSIKGARALVIEAVSHHLRARGIDVDAPARRRDR